MDRYGGKAHQHRDSEGQGRGRSHGHDREQAPFHDAKALDADRIRGIRVIDEQPRQIEQAREPGHHRHDVKGLEPKQRALPRRKAES
jgi:hypothetical protein